MARPPRRCAPRGRRLQLCSGRGRWKCAVSSRSPARASCPKPGQPLAGQPPGSASADRSTAACLALALLHTQAQPAVASVSAGAAANAKLVGDVLAADEEEAAAGEEGTAEDTGGASGGTDGDEEGDWSASDDTSADDGSADDEGSDWSGADEGEEEEEEEVRGAGGAGGWAGGMVVGTLRVQGARAAGGHGAASPAPARCRWSLNPRVPAPALRSARAPTPF